MAKKKDKVNPKSPFASLRGVKEKLEKEEAAKNEGRATPSASKGRADARARAEPASPNTAEDDRLAFHRMMSGVTPMTQEKGRVARSAVPRSGELVPRGRGAEAEAARKHEEDEVHAHLRALVEGKQRFEVEDDGHRVSGRRVDFPKEALRKLRSGTTPIDARLDLHGMAAGEARGAVEAFLRNARASGERCVLVIHGKGEHSPRAQPVLRGEIGAWLSQGAASEHVAAFVTTDKDDGGEGAVYVAIRR